MPDWDLTDGRFRCIPPPRNATNILRLISTEAVSFYLNSEVSPEKISCCFCCLFHRHHPIPRSALTHKISRRAIEERQNAAKAIVLLQKIVGKLDAKFDKAGYLLNADQVCIQYLQKLKARRIYLLEQEMKLMDQQNELLKKVKKQTKD